MTPRNRVVEPTQQALADTALRPADVGSHTVSVIDTATNTVTATVPVGAGPARLAVDPGPNRVYVTNLSSVTVSVIDAAASTVTATIVSDAAPLGVAVDPDRDRCT